jgi:quercetin dioxygenase-like cupin family protein
VANAPREIEDPTTGQRWVFLRTGADTNGELLEAELHVSPGGYVPSHLHPSQEETFTGVSGTFVLEIAGETKTIRPGETLVIPPRTPHGFASAPEAAQLLVTVRPALRLDDYFRVFLGLSRDRTIRAPERGLPRPLLQVAVVMNEFAPEVAAGGIPLPLQRIFFRALGAVGRWRGYRASFEEYGVPR